MTVTIKGREALQRRLLEEIPRKIAEVLEGAARAGGKVIADDARQRCESSEVRGSIKVKIVAGEHSTVSAKVQTLGKGSYIAPWLEYGTDPHWISINEEERRGYHDGLSINALNKRGSHSTLVINGKPVGKNVFHPGARPHPFLRPAIDASRSEALAAAQKYITARMVRGGSGGGSQDD